MAADMTVWSMQKTGLWRRKHNEWHMAGFRSLFTKSNRSHFTYIVQPIIWTLLSMMQCLEYAKCRIFFSTVQELYAFFDHSIRRWDLMASITGESAVTLKKLNSIRWAGRLSWLLGIKHRYWDHWDVMKALQGSHCFGEQEVLSVVMHWSSRSCCRRLSLCWFLFCWQKYYQHCFSSSAVERCWS